MANATLVKTIFTHIQGNPDISVKQILVSLNPDHPQSVHSALGSLVKRGLINATNSKPRRYTALHTGEYPEYKPRNPEKLKRPKKPRSSKARLVDPKTILITDVVKQLEEQIEALSAWKEHALTRHPDLAFSDITLKAMRIVARHYRDIQMVEKIMRGEMNDKPIIQSVIEALEG